MRKQGNESRERKQEGTAKGERRESPKYGKGETRATQRKRPLTLLIKEEPATVSLACVGRREEGQSEVVKRRKGSKEELSKLRLASLFFSFWQSG